MISSTVVADFLKDSWRPRALGYSNLATKTHPFVLDNFPTQTQISVAIFEVQRVHPDAGHVLEFSVRKNLVLSLQAPQWGYWILQMPQNGRWKIMATGSEKWETKMRHRIQGTIPTGRRERDNRAALAHRRGLL